MPVSIPCLEEQQKIANFLSAFDEAIGYAKQELEKWKELGKGFAADVCLTILEIRRCINDKI